MVVDISMLAVDKNPLFIADVQLAHILQNKTPFGAALRSTHIFTERCDRPRKSVSGELKPLANTGTLSGLRTLERLLEAGLAGLVDHGGGDLVGHDGQIGFPSRSRVNAHELITKIEIPEDIYFEPFSTFVKTCAVRMGKSACRAAKEVLIFGRSPDRNSGGVADAKEGASLPMPSCC